jgi:4-hydroxythreonine-4-phosphate dehydrogenase
MLSIVTITDINLVNSLIQITHGANKDKDYPIDKYNHPCIFFSKNYCFHMHYSRNKLIRLAITMGDPGGIGPEVSLKAVYQSRWPAAVRFILIGSREIWCECASKFHLPVPVIIEGVDDVVSARVSVLDPDLASSVIPARLQSPMLQHCGQAKAGIYPPWRTTCVGMTKKNWRAGKTGPTEGLASMLWIRTAVAGCQTGQFDAIVTGPICKASVQAAGFDFPGHTEYLAHLSGSKKFAMMLMGGPLRVVLVTRHLPLASVAGAITRKKVFNAVEMADLGIKWLGLPKKNIGVCALNPHAGDDGLLGGEEQTIIAPVIRRLRQRGMKIEGPVPADVIFHQAMQNKFGAIVAMYHDQGLAPLKMIAFENGVNLTLGLSFVRTSPDHGTAFDIAGKGVANAESMMAAINLAIKLARRPNPWK